MANRIADNVIIIDSAMGNSFILDSGGRVVHLDRMAVNAFAFYAGDTTSTISISAVDTTNTIYSEAFLGAGERFKFRAFGKPQMFADLKVPVLTNGTGFIYLA